MRASFGVMVCAVLLSGCVSNARAQGASSAQTEWFDRVMIACFKDQAARLDDYRSDARSVGSAVLSACREEVTATIQANGARLTVEGYQRFERQTRAGLVDVAAQAVLMGRRQAPTQ